MFVVVTRLNIPAADAEQARAVIYRQLVAAMQRTAGFIEFYSVPAGSGASPESVINVSVWESEAAFHEYFTARDTIVSMPGTRGLVQGAPERLAIGEALFHAAGANS
jgi:heme-degrading monooxygenase HmoA